MYIGIQLCICGINVVIFSVFGIGMVLLLVNCCGGVDGGFGMLCLIVYLWKIGYVYWLQVIVMQVNCSDGCLIVDGFIMDVVIGVMMLIGSIVVLVDWGGLLSLVYLFDEYFLFNVVLKDLMQWLCVLYVCYMMLLLYFYLKDIDYLMIEWLIWLNMGKDKCVVLLGMLNVWVMLVNMMIYQFENGFLFGSFGVLK